MRYARVYRRKRKKRRVWRHRFSKLSSAESSKQDEFEARRIVGYAKDYRLLTCRLEFCQWRGIEVQIVVLSRYSGNSFGFDIQEGGDIQQRDMKSTSSNTFDNGP